MHRGLSRPPTDIMGYGKRAGGTPPTGMHFCYKLINFSVSLDHVSFSVNWPRTNAPPAGNLN